MSMIFYLFINRDLRSTINGGLYKIQLQKRTKDFAVRVFKMVEKLPKSKGAVVIAYQLIKTSTSVAANYRAVCRAKSEADFINKPKIVV